ncbi:DUF3014 domain-containing protein [Methylotuvimicrobium alcaliphilum]|uniref:DUF3014 domain-containing protein n=1 Tax=Methylotuvimicrobium alcaliphilum (strain DSM 19304 / NCIMB 14124 / VKM B-2133 / 20Z) TaxID=1091494 RepID=G4SZ09_META2|nr:DUF3014 domain-containing protein [Methylotuvimicrobium alcaliphilum]CCE25466.1 conserved protein of unknown function [Methylotuvimicrobium alcaliphilum 20Z]
MGCYDLYQRRKPIGMIVFLLILLLIIAGGAWLYWRSTQTIESEVGLETYELPVPSVTKLDEALVSNVLSDNELKTNSEQAETEETEPTAIPSLKESDDFINEKLTALSPELAYWLRSDEQIRKIILIINDFSQGQRLHKHMRWLSLDEPFIAEEDQQGLYLPSKSYQRYNAFAEAIDSVNVHDILEFYQKVRPLCQEVFAQFGYPDSYRLEDLIKKAGAEILSAPVVETRIALIKPSVLYQFADNDMEALSPVQKQMLRMGPHNTRIIQNKLRLLIEALINMDDTN